MTKAELERQVAALFDDKDGNNPGCEVIANNDGSLTVRAFAMYESVSVTPGRLESLAQLVGTDAIDVGDTERTRDGCDSCDYGSELSIDFTVKDSPLWASLKKAEAE